MDTKKLPVSSLYDIYSPSWIYLNFLLNPLIPSRLWIKESYKFFAAGFCLGFYDFLMDTRLYKIKTSTRIVKLIYQ